MTIVPLATFKYVNTPFDVKGIHTPRFIKIGSLAKGFAGNKKAIKRR